MVGNDDSCHGEEETSVYQEEEQLFNSNEANIAAERGMMDVEDPNREEYEEHCLTRSAK